MMTIRIEPDAEPRVVDLPMRAIEQALHDIIHEEELPIEGTMSLSALKTDGLEPNEKMVNLTGDDGYLGTVFICGARYRSLTRDQIYAFFDWLEEGTLPGRTNSHEITWVPEGEIEAIWAPEWEEE